MAPNRKILIIDDNADIHNDFRKVFAAAQQRVAEIDELEADLFAASLERRPAVDVLLVTTIDSAYQGEEGIAMAIAAAQKGEPYYLAFVDVRMPPGIDGIQTIKQLWQALPDLQCVICTAYSDYAWEDIVAQLGTSGNLLILKKPFDVIEVLHLAQALAEKVDLGKSARDTMATLQRKVRELTRAEAELQRYNEELLQAKTTLEAQAAELARKHAQLEVARAGAEAANQAKSRFLATISHELRTPLSGITGMLHLLLATNLKGQQARYARTAKTSAEALLKLINDILDFSKIEAGKLEIENIDFDLRLAVDNVMEMVAHEARKKGLELACALDPQVPWRLRGDPGRVRQVLANLTSNAVKFTEHGEVVLRAVLAAETDQKVTVRFAVHDTGIGIPADRMGRLFQSFAQVDSSTTRKYGGTGLGLAISKRLCELLGGEIGAESSPGQGSTFWCTMTLDKQPEASSQLASLVPPTRGKRVLVADNNATWRSILQEQLSVWGFDCQTATDGKDAWQALESAAAARQPFHVALLDMKIQGMDAFQVARAVQANPELAGTALILLTSWGDQIDNMLRTKGFAHCLTKPVLQFELFDAVAQAQAATEAVARGRNGDPEPLPTIKCATAARVQRKRARILLAEDNEINQEVAREILKSAGYHCDVVPDGKQAVEAILQKPYDLVLMDCYMPEMDGFEATQVIRQSEKAGRLPGKRSRLIPIVAVTASALKGDRERCLKAGMNDYLSKPFDPELVIQKVEAHLAKGEAPAKPAAGLPACNGSTAQQAQEMDGINAASDGPLPAIDYGSLLQRCMGDHELVEKVIAKFQARAGAELDQIQRHIEDGNVKQVRLLAHRLKSAAANLSAEPLALAAGRLETMADFADRSTTAGWLADLRNEWDRFLQETHGVITANLEKDDQWAKV